MKWVGLLTALWIAFAVPSRATYAQGAPPTDALPGDRAVALARDGLAAYEAGKWDEAYAKFREAEALAHSPAFRIYMARARANQNKLIDAREVYREIVGEPIPDDAPQSWQRAQADARAELTALETKMPSVVLRVSGASTVVIAEIDGNAVALGAPIELDPGPHRARIKDGAAKVETSFEVRVGDRAREIALALPASRAPITSPMDPAAAEGSLAPGITLLALGGASLIAGAVLGGVALAQSDSLDSECEGGCPADLSETDYESRRSDIRAIAHASTGTLVGGGVLAAVGVILVIVRPGGDDGPTVTVGASGLSLGGTF